MLFSLAILLLGFIASATYIIISYTFIIFTVLKCRQKVMKKDVGLNQYISRDNVERQPGTTNYGKIFYIGHAKNQEIQEHAYLAILKTTKTLLIITVLFTAVFMPFIILSSFIGNRLALKENKNNIELSVYQIAIRLVLINNVANPFIYAFNDVRFKKKLKLYYKSCLVK